MKYVNVPVCRQQTVHPVEAKISDIFTTVPKLNKKALEKLDQEIQKIKDNTNDALSKVYNDSSKPSTERTKILTKLRKTRDDTISRLENKKRDVHKEYHEKLEAWKNASVLKKAGKMTAKALLKTTLFSVSFIAVGAWAAVKDATATVGKAMGFGKSSSTQPPTPPPPPPAR